MYLKTTIYLLSIQLVTSQNRTISQILAGSQAIKKQRYKENPFIEYYKVSNIYCSERTLYTVLFYGAAYEQTLLFPASPRWEFRLGALSVPWSHSQGTGTAAITNHF